MKTRCFSFPLFVLVALTLIGMILPTAASHAEMAKGVYNSVKAGNGELPAAVKQQANIIKSKTPGQAYPVPRPPFSSDFIFPCTSCHAQMKPNPTRRALTEFHTDIILHHAEGERWCTDCHNLTNRDKLRLVSGELIDFSESYRLCGQCHGDKYRDWKVGVHGKRTGYWNGDKQYLLCVHCHSPHDPKFKPLKPLPPPERPGNMKR